VALPEYKPATHVIQLKGAPFYVRGLSLEDITYLVNNHLPDLEKISDLYEQHTQNVFTDEAMKKLMLRLLSELPAVASEIIACAADAPGEGTKVRKYPAPVQIESLFVIARLTFEEVGGVKKFIEHLSSTMGDLLSPEKMQVLKKLTKEQQ
jgi:hypothetical protein